jgi:transposase-like protein
LFTPDHRGKFSPQFNAEAVQIVIETGKPIAEVVRDLRVHDGTLGNCVKRGCTSTPSRTSPSPHQNLRVCRNRGRDSPVADGRDMVASPIVYRLDTG